MYEYEHLMGEVEEMLMEQLDELECYLEQTESSHRYYNDENYGMGYYESIFWDHYGNE